MSMIILVVFKAVNKPTFQGEKEPDIVFKINKAQMFFGLYGR